MFIGHFAVALAAKKVAPKPSLGTYFMAVSFLDLLWPPLLLLGIEHVKIEPGNTAHTPLAFIDYPYSHSLLFTIIWSIMFAGAYYLLRRDKPGTIALGIGVASHWVLDAITHRPDLPLAPGSSTYIGFGLWNSVLWTIIIEGAMFIAGVILYARTTRAKDKTGNISFWSLITFLVIAYGMDAQGTPPPSEQFLAWFALGAWLLVMWGGWIERHRSMNA
jgi:hypothetical protein